MSDQSGKSPQNQNHKVALFWSGGKDSLLALMELKKLSYDVVALVTTINYNNKVVLHAVNTDLLEKQAKALEIPLVTIAMPSFPTNEEYEEKVLAKLSDLKTQGVTHIAFGDIHLTDVKAYREKLVLQSGLKTLFPLWQKSSKELMHSFLKDGFEAIITTVNPKNLDRPFTGQKLTDTLIRKLPDSVDVCGENGEFHTFVFDGPNFRESVPFQKKPIVLRDGFYFCDLES